MLTVLQPAAAPTRIATMPGDTHADPATQKSALQYAQAVAIRASPPNCKQQSFIDTRFDGYTGLPDPDDHATAARAGPGAEDWTLFACGTHVRHRADVHAERQGHRSCSATNPVKRS